MLNEIKKDTENRMTKSLTALSNELTHIRTGRANPALLDGIEVDYYGSSTPLTQVANINVADARTLAVTPWEKNMVGAVEKAIIDSNLGLNPNSAGMTIRIPLPPLTEERRKDLTRLVAQEGENAKIALRNIRRDANSQLKELLKEKEITEDDERKAETEIQKITDTYVAKVDGVVKVKSDEVMEI
ncbi:MAG: ribosome recycling factor [bacterium]